MIVSALGSVDALLAVIADPKAAKANRDALAQEATAVEAKLAEVTAREAAIAEQKKANADTAAQLDMERKAVGAALAAHSLDHQALVDAGRALVAQKAEHAERVAAADDQAKGLAATAAQLAEREAQLAKVTEQHRLDTEAAHNALIAREKAVVAGEAELKAKRDKLAKALSA